ncbi:MAG: hypothetical protein HY919_05215 [Elusimicrobia bacterium]|nr:hypothetical protein [Elusimicrobiota bacterium]
MATTRLHKKCHCERSEAILVLMMGLPRAFALAMTTLLSSVKIREICGYRTRGVLGDVGYGKI